MGLMRIDLTNVISFNTIDKMNSHDIIKFGTSSQYMYFQAPANHQGRKREQKKKKKRRRRRKVRLCIYLQIYGYLSPVEHGLDCAKSDLWVLII